MDLSPRSPKADVLAAVSEKNETEALRLWRSALNSYETTLKDHPDLPELRRDIASVLDTIGNYFLSKKDLDPQEAITLYRKACKTIEELPAPIRNTRDFQELAAWSYELKASALSRTGPVTDVVGSYQTAIELREAVARKWPTSDTYGRLAQSRQWLAEAYVTANDMQNARAAYEVVFRIEVDTPETGHRTVDGAITVVVRSPALQD